MLRKIREALNMMGEKYEGTKAEVLLLAIGFQESEWVYRKQFFNGPARGFFMFEPIAVKEVLTNPYTRSKANEICRKLNIDPAHVYGALEHNDLLAICFARLLLWRDPRALPYDPKSAWEYYMDNWRPGKPRPNKWKNNYLKSINIVMADQPDTNEPLERQLYVIFTEEGQDLPESPEYGCEEVSEGFVKTFVNLNEEEKTVIENDGFTLAFVGKRPNDRG